MVPTAASAAEWLIPRRVFGGSKTSAATGGCPTTVGEWRGHASTWIHTNPESCYTYPPIQRGVE